jgi:hypothetical protein
MPNHRGTPAIRDYSDIVLPGILQQPAHMFAGFGKSDTIWKRVNVATAHLQNIGQTLATGMADTLLTVPINQWMLW